MYRARFIVDTNKAGLYLKSANGNLKINQSIADWYAHERIFYFPFLRTFDACDVVIVGFEIEINENNQLYVEVREIIKEV